MLTSDNWLIANADKIPVTPCSQQRIKGDKASHTMTAQDAISLIENGQHDHLVFYHTNDNPIVSLDIDSCQHPDTHQLNDWCQQFIDENPIGYMESSSSHTGLRICCTTTEKTFSKRIYYIDPQHYQQSAPKGAEKIEVMASNCLATYTGTLHPQCQHPQQMTQLEPVLQWLDQHYPIPTPLTPSASTVSTQHYPNTTDTSKDTIIHALSFIPPDINHDDWKQIGMALHDWCPTQGLDLWINWSQGSDQYKNNKECGQSWRSFSPGGITLSTLFHHAKQYGYLPEPHTATQTMSKLNPDNTPPIPLFSLQQIKQLPVVPFLINPLLPETGYVQLFGNSGAFKSFVALDMALAIASGTPWLNHKTKKGTVVYLCGEGVFGMGARLRAWATQDIQINDNALLMSPFMPDLNNMETVSHLINYLKTFPDLRLIIIDTFARAMVHFGNENDNTDVGTFTRVIDYLRQQLKCLIVQVHHTGHKNKDRARGASGLYAALDAEYHCVRLGDYDGYIECTKAKDFKEPDIVNYSLKPVTREGNDSLIVVPRTHATPSGREEAMQKTWKERLSSKHFSMMKTYQDLYQLYSTNALKNDNVTPRVSIRDFKEQLVSSGICIQKHVSRDVNTLISKGLMLTEGAYIRVKDNYDQ